jgi:hypothetical protein
MTPRPWLGKACCTKCVCVYVCVCVCVCVHVCMLTCVHLQWRWVHTGLQVLLAMLISGLDGGVI